MATTTTITLKVPGELAERWQTLPEAERDAITAGPVVTAFAQALNRATGARDNETEDTEDAAEAEARQRRQEAGRRFLARTEKGVDLGGVLIDRDALYDRD
jgi:hypothetical protein